MGNLYPLLMLPGFDPRPWGTHDLSPIYPNHKFEEKIGDALVACDYCKTSHRPLRGKTSYTLNGEYSRRRTEEPTRHLLRFPLLLKFLFPHDKLSGHMD